MSGTPNPGFWDHVWRCREELDKSAAAHRVPCAVFSVSSVSSVGSPSLSKTEWDSKAQAWSFLQDAQLRQSWRWQRVLVFCNYVLELLLALRFEEACGLINGLLEQKALWAALQRDEQHKHHHLLTTLIFFETIRGLNRDTMATQDASQATTVPALQYDMYYRASLVDYVQTQVGQQFEAQYNSRWYRRTFARDATLYINKIRTHVQLYDAKALRRWPWWHALVGWWQSIDEKRYVLSLYDLKEHIQKLEPNTAEPQLPAIKTALDDSTRLRLTGIAMPLRFFALHENLRGTIMSRTDEVPPEITVSPLERMERQLAQWQTKLQELALNSIQTSHSAYMQGRITSDDQAWSLIHQQGKSFQDQLRNQCHTYALDKAVCDDLMARLAKIHGEVQRSIVSWAQDLLPCLARLQLEIVQHKPPYQEQEPLMRELQRYRQFREKFNREITQPYETQKQAFLSLPLKDTVVHPAILAQFEQHYRSLTKDHEKYFTQYDRYLTNRLVAFCNGYEAYLLKELEQCYQDMQRGRVNKDGVSLRIQTQLIDPLQQLRDVVDFEPRSAKLKQACDRLNHYCQFHASLMLLPTQFERSIQFKTAVQACTVHLPPLKKIGSFSIPKLTAVVEDLATQQRHLTDRQRKERLAVLQKTSALLQRYWDAYKAAHTKWSELEPLSTLRLSAELGFNNPQHHKKDRYGIEAWLHFNRRPNQYLFSFNEQERSWSVLGRDDQGQIHRFKLDVSTVPWRQHAALLSRLVARYEENRYKRQGDLNHELPEQVWCYPLLVTLAHVIQQPLFSASGTNNISNPADMQEPQPTHLPCVTQYLQTQLQQHYQKQYLPFCQQLFAAKDVLKQWRWLMNTALNDLNMFENVGETLADDAAQASEAIQPAPSTQLTALGSECWTLLVNTSLPRPLPTFKRNQCLTIVPYVAHPDQAPLAIFTKDEQQDELMHRAKVEFDYAEYELRLCMLETLRAHHHQCADIEVWCQHVVADPVLQGKWAALQAAYKTFDVHAHPDKTEPVLRGLHQDIQRFFNKNVDNARHDIEPGYREHRDFCSDDSHAALKRFIRSEYINCIDQGLPNAQKVVDADSITQMDDQDRTGVYDLRTYKGHIYDAALERGQREAAEAREREAQARADQERRAKEQETARADQEKARADQERRAKEQETARADQERREKEAAQAELEKLKEELTKEKSSPDKNATHNQGPHQRPDEDDEDDEDEFHDASSSPGPGFFKGSH